MNKTQYVFINKMYVYILIACIFLIGCPQRNEVSMSDKGKQFVLRSNHPPRRFKNIDINAEQAEMSDYTNDAGEKKHGWVASIQVWLIGKTEPIYNNPIVERFYVYPGKTVKWQGYSIYIEDIVVTPEELKIREEKLREARERNLPGTPPGMPFGTVTLRVKKE